jgi:uncharacterized membrane protein
MTARLILNMLAVIGMASFTGAMLTIGLTLGAYWKSLPPGEFLDWFATNSHLVGRTIPIFAVPAVVGLVGSLWLGWTIPSQRYLWLAALVCTIGLFAVTAIHHLPANAAFAAKTVAHDRVAAMLDTWLALHWVRISLGLAASVLGLLATVR